MFSFTFLLFIGCDEDDKKTNDSNANSQTDDSSDDSSISLQDTGLSSFNPNVYYYDDLMTNGGRLDVMLTYRSELSDIVTAGSFVTSFLEAETNDDIHGEGHALFLGFSQGEVARALFEDNTFEVLVDVEVIRESSESWNNAAVRSLAYDQDAGQLYVGLGRYTYNIQELDEDSYLEALTGGDLDPSILNYNSDLTWASVEQTKGAGIWIFNFNDWTWTEIKESSTEEESVAELRPVVYDDGTRYVVALIGTEGAPDTVIEALAYIFKADDSDVISTLSGTLTTSNDIETIYVYNLDSTEI